MFPARYWPNRYFTRRYWPKIGSTAVVIAGPHLVARQALFVSGATIGDTLQHVQRGGTFIAGAVTGEGKP